MDRNTPPFFRRFYREIKEISVIVGLVAFYAIYANIPFVARVVDTAVRPAVAGCTKAGEIISTFLFRHTGLDLGLSVHQPDPALVFRGQLAGYVNAGNPHPLVKLAADQLAPLWRRE